MLSVPLKSQHRAGTAYICELPHASAGENEKSKYAEESQREMRMRMSVTGAAHPSGLCSVQNPYFVDGHRARAGSRGAKGSRLKADLTPEHSIPKAGRHHKDDAAYSYERHKRA